MAQLSNTASPGAVPAQLGFLAIYNPSLGTTDDTMEDQIVYYSSVGPPSGSSRRRRTSTTTDSKEERNERLRQIGLAQGMVEFGRSFSGDRPVDTIETEKARVVLHELEPGWWLLASIDLTRLPASTSGSKTGGSTAAKGKGAGQAEEAPAVEYSTREVKPAALLLQDLLRAHSVFLLHHDSSLSALFVRTAQRERFTAILSRYWDLFLASWNVMLHGNPLRNVFGGIKMAASGELGVGVGEEERGSGEREVLEGLVGRIDGLVDLVVGKFGEGDEEGGEAKKEGQRWLGTGNEPGAEDGAIFLGVGALSRPSLRNVAYWMEDLYTWGENAYGVRESPTTTRSRARRKRPANRSISARVSASGPAPAPISPPEPQSDSVSPSGFLPPPPIVRSGAQAGLAPTGTKSAIQPAKDDVDTHGVTKLTGYLKLGYGTYWTLGSSEKGDPDLPARGDEATASNARPSQSSTTPQDDATGHYLIGLMGNVEEPASTENLSDDGGQADEDPEHNTRTLLRTLTVELNNSPEDTKDKPESHDLGSHDNEVTTTTSSPSQSQSSSSSSTSSGQTRTPANYLPHQQTTFDSQDRNKTTKLRVLVYCSKPFIYLLLFTPHTDSLNWETPYRSLHHQLAPLRKSLLASTSYRPARLSQIYDLVYDAAEMTIHSTIPHIPTGRDDPFHSIVWVGGRVEALNTHTQLLNTFSSTRFAETELERTAKTSRGWWIVWSCVLSTSPTDSGSIAGNRSNPDDGVGERGGSDEETTPTQDVDDPLPVVGKEIFLIRKSGDTAGAGGGVASLVPGAVGGGWADGASRLAQGIGVDTRKYIEGLLSLNR
jgi:hypothetical protein